MFHPKPIVLSLTMALLLVLAAGCGSNHDDTAVPTQDLREPEQMLQDSASELQSADSIEVEMDVSGYPVEIEPIGLDLPEGLPLLFKYARGIFQAPDRMNASVQFGIGGLSTTADLIALDRDHYFRSDVLTANQWINAEVIPGFSPAALLSAEMGLPFALRSIIGPEMVGTQRLNGLDVFHLQGTIQASAVHSLTFGLVRSKDGEIQVQVYIDIHSLRVAQITLTEPPPSAESDAEPTTWDISILNYNQSVSITAPNIGDTP